jgi:TldD protein
LVEKVFKQSNIFCVFYSGREFVLIVDLAEKAVRLAMDLGVEYADVRAEQVNSTSVRLTNDRFEQAVSGIDQGLGIRVLYKGAWGFSSTSSLEAKDIQATVDTAFKIAKATSKRVKEKAKVCTVKLVKDKVTVKASQPLTEVGIDKKMKLVLGFSKTAKDYSSSVVSVTLAYEDVAGQKAVVSSDGAQILNNLSRVYASVNAVAKQGEKLTSARERMGKIGGFELFNEVSGDKIIEKAAERAVNLLKAKPAPSGRFTVIVDPRLAGVFAHEAVGHCCEADLVIAGESILAGKIGQIVGSKLVSIYDDSTLVGGWGSQKYDDEGVPTKKRLLIDKGVLKGYITNKEAAAKLNMEPNGGARAESFSYPPIVRMSDTYIARGDQTFEELLEGIDYGVYLKASRGGQVDTAKGTFQFNAEEAGLIEEGELTTPLLDVSLSGITLETLHNIDAVGKDFEISLGFCGKGQTVPAGDASPHIRIKNALVGGRA